MPHLELAHRVEGPPSAPVLVLVNPLGSTMDLWEPVAARFRGHFRLVRYDQRGHGRSPVPPGPYRLEDLGNDLISLLDGLGIERASVCGMSIGGLVGMWLGIHHPDRLEALVLCGTAPTFPPASGWVEREALVRAEGMEPIVGPALLRWLPRGFAERDPEMTARVAAMLRDCDANCCGVLGTADLRPTLRSIVAPTLVIGGLEDPVCTPAVCSELAAGIPEASLLVLAGTSHVVHVGQPARFADAVIAHVAGPAFERGEAIRRSSLGDAYVDGALSSGEGTAFSASIQDAVTRLAWGEVWSRPGLDRRTRSAVTVAALAALGRVEELELHIPAAIRNGLTVEELGELLLQCAIYAGFPAAVTGMNVARRVLDL